MERAAELPRTHALPDEVPDFSWTDEPATVEALPFSFTGTASEYFRIWLVNLGLSILSLGIYSAWAKVRTRRYFYGNTRVAGSSFAYLANPVTILKGRLIAVAVFVGYSIATNLQPLLSVPLSVAFFISLPWLMVRALSFRNRNSAFRNTRFGFTGTASQAAAPYLLFPILSFLALGLLIPWTTYRQQQFVVDHARFGGTSFRLHATTRQFYGLYMRLAVSMVATVLFFSTFPLLALLGVLRPLLVPLSLVGFLLFMYGLVGLSTGQANLVYNSTTLGEHRFCSSLLTRTMFGLYVVNSLAVVLSLGLLLPWARVRTAQYRASCMTILAAGGLDRFVAAQDTETSALGDEIGEFFNIDVGI